MEQETTKKESAVGKFIQDTPPWAKGLIAVAAIGGGYLIYRAITKGKIGSGNAPIPQSETIVKDEKRFADAGQRLTFPLTSYVSMADSIFNSFNLNTNILDPVKEKEIYAVFDKMKNDIDVLQLIKSFGKRDAPIPFLRLVIPSISLGAWLREGLSDTQLAQLNSTLIRKGIKLQF